MTKIAFKTLGCRVNLYETDALASQFKESGFQIANANQEADIFVVNTCTVTNQSDQKCRQIIHQIRRNNPEAKIIVTGCMVNNHKQEILQSGLADYAIDNERKSALFSIISAISNGEPCDPEGFNIDLFGYRPAFDTFHTRSLVKIHDGCNNFCSYCIIPMVRGRSTSRPAKDIYENIHELIDHDFKEIVLTGVNMGRYQYEGTSFEQLVENILEIPGDFRVRISSIEPDQFSDHFLTLFQHEKLAPHMHICLQSGCDVTLQRMHRFYSTEEFRNMCERIKAGFPDFNITTDIIVGFPGETENDFDTSLKFAQEIGFSHIHTFKYSVRSGTVAAKMPDQIPESVKTIRSQKMRQVSADNKVRYLDQMFGKTQKLLIERVGADGTATGHGENYIPIRCKAKGLERNTTINVKIADFINKDKDEKASCIGEII